MPLYILLMSEITQPLAFLWITSLEMIPSNSNPSFSKRQDFILKLNNILLCLYNTTSLSIHSIPVDLGCVNILAIANISAMSVSVHIYLFKLGCFLDSLDRWKRSWRTGSHRSSIFNLWNVSILFPIETKPTANETFFSPHPHQHW